MKFMTSCDECLHKDSRATLFYVPFQESGLYDVTCDHGHRRKFVVQAQPFEVLYQIASIAIMDGYYREAVTSFASSLERFYEFAIRVFLRAGGMKHQDIPAAWNAIGNRSERQAGAFVALWIAQFGSAPEMLKSNRQEFRNDVVHNGLIPSRDKAVEFGQWVLDLIRPQRAMLKSALQEQITDIVGRRNGDLMRSVGADFQVSLTDTPSAVSLASDSPQPDSLSEIIEQMQETKRTFEGMATMLKTHSARITDAIRKAAEEQGQ